MAKRDILKEAIADAKAVKETAIANAKAALEEAFTPQLKSMLSAKLEEMEKEEMDEEVVAEETVNEETVEEMTAKEKAEGDDRKDGKIEDETEEMREAEGIEGWQQSKITKAADYIGSVYHSLDYDMKFGEAEVTEATSEATCGCDSSCSHCGGKHTMNEIGKKCSCCGNKVKAVASEGKSPHKKGTKKYKKHMAAMHAESLQDRLAAKLESKKKTNERSLTKGEEGKREKYVKGMKKAKGDFKKRYGKDAEAVMYATATKMAKK